MSKNKNSSKKRRRERQQKLRLEQAETHQGSHAPENQLMSLSNGSPLPKSLAVSPGKQTAKALPPIVAPPVASVPSEQRANGLLLANPPTSFGSRKRQLTRVGFVFPKRNGQRGDFHFGGSKPPEGGAVSASPNSAGQSPNSMVHAKQAAAPTPAYRTNVTIEEIFSMNKRKRTDNGAERVVPVIMRQPLMLPSTDILAKGKNEKAVANGNNDRTRTYKAETATAAAATPTRAPEVHGAAGHLSGRSVEDIVRDKLGCRPRANSTDGELNLPQRGLCDERKVLLAHRWDLDTHHDMTRVSPQGFVNLGNTCFLNSTLQCLAYLPPLCQSLMAMPQAQAHGGNSGKNGTKGGGKVSQGKKVTLMLRSLFHKVHGTSSSGSNHAGHALAPKAIVNAVPSLGSGGSRNGYKFRPGRQEDAHEFLVHLLDSMNDGELKESGINQHASGWRDRLPIPRLDETTYIHRIFGGYLRSQVRCTSCGNCSNTYDPFLDLSLEVSRKSCQSVGSAFVEFTRKETLDSENRWKCSGCKKRVCATKQLTVFRPPLTLCIQLKRFTYGGMGFGGFANSGYGNYGGFGGGRGGKKISKPIEFPADLKLSLSDGRSCAYSLTGIIIHVGGSASSGHYTAYVKKPSKNGGHQWFHMDDSFVETVSERTVLKQRDAYILFYCRKEVKLEFPSPPLRASMSAEEAKELGRLRAKARADSLDTAASSVQQSNPTASKKASSTSPMRVSVKPDEETLISLSRDSKKETKETLSTTSESVSRETKSSEFSSSSSSESLDTRSEEPEAGAPRKSLNQARRDQADSSTSDSASESESDSSETADASDKLATSNLKASVSALEEESSNESASISDESSAQEPVTSAIVPASRQIPPGEESSEEASSSSDEIATAPAGGPASTRLPDPSSSASTKETTSLTTTPPSATSSTPMEKESVESKSSKANEAAKTAPRTRIVLGRAEGRSKVEVMMGPRFKSKAWKPRTVAVAKGQEYHLLGNLKVDAWDDDDDGNDDDGNDDGGPQETSLKGHQLLDHNERANIVQQMEKSERKRKRKMFVNRWDAQLDYGKVSACQTLLPLCAAEGIATDHSPLFFSASFDRQRRSRSKRTSKRSNSTLPPRTMFFSASKQASKE